mgnify:CR=1 FL=1
MTLNKNRFNIKYHCEASQCSRRLVGVHAPRESKSVLPFLTYQNYFLRIFIFIDFFKKNAYTISVKKKSYQIDDCPDS